MTEPRTLRTTLWMFVAAFASTGCLFPSFEGMEGGPRKDESPLASADAGASSRAASSAPPARALPSSAPPATDGGTPKLLLSQVGCGPQSCDVSQGGVCCVGIIGGTSCAKSASECFGVVRCDTSDQCSNGDVCCALMGEVSCKPRSKCTFGRTACRPESPRCAGGSTCELAPSLVGDLSLSVCSIL